MSAGGAQRVPAGDQPVSAAIIAAARDLHTLIINYRQPASAKPTPLEIEYTAHLNALGEALKAQDPAYDPQPANPEREPRP